MKQIKYLRFVSWIVHKICNQKQYNYSETFTIHSIVIVVLLVLALIPQIVKVQN